MFRSTLLFKMCVCASVCARHFVKIFEKYAGIELQMSEQEGNTLPLELFSTFNLSDYFTK